MVNIKDPALLFYTADFLTACADLTMEERGQYITLLCLEHQKGRLSKRTIDIATPNISDYVLKKFKVDEQGFFYNERLEFETEKRKNYSESRRANGSKGGRPKTKIKPYGFENETICETITKPYQNHSVNENINVNINENDNINIDDLFNEFWKAYPKKIAKDYAYKCFVKLKPTKELLDEMLNTISRAKRSKTMWLDKKYIPNPATWLNQGRWKDEIPESDLASFDADEFFELAVRKSYEEEEEE